MAQPPNAQLAMAVIVSHSNLIGIRITATAKAINPHGDVTSRAPVAKDANRKTNKIVHPHPENRVASRPRPTTTVVKIASQ